MADTKRFLPGPGGGVLIDIEEAAERKRFGPGGAIVIELAVTSGGHTVSIGQTSETDTAQAITAKKVVTLGFPTETDTAQAITRGGQQITVGQASETDTAQAVTTRKTVTLGLPAETDTAQEITLVQGDEQIIAVEQTTEIDTAQAITTHKRKALGQCTETDTAQTITAAKVRTLGQITETDTAQSIAWAPKRRFVDMALEIDLAQPITVVGGTVVVEEHRGGVHSAVFKTRRDRRENKKKIRKPWMVVDDVVIPPKIDLPTDITITIPLPTGDVFKQSISERQQLVREEVLAQVLAAYKVDRLEDLPTYDDEEEVVTIVNLLIEQGYIDV